MTHLIHIYLQTACFPNKIRETVLRSILRVEQLLLLLMYFLFPLKIMPQISVFLIFYSYFCSNFTKILKSTSLNYLCFKNHPLCALQVIYNICGCDGLFSRDLYWTNAGTACFWQISSHRASVMKNEERICVSWPSVIDCLPSIAVWSTLIFYKTMGIIMSTTEHPLFLVWEAVKTFWFSILQGILVELEGTGP